MSLWEYSELFWVPQILRVKRVDQSVVHARLDRWMNFNYRILLGSDIIRKFIRSRDSWGYIYSEQVI